MLINAINWRHIVGAVATGLIFSIAGIINFWTFLALIGLGIVLALIQYLPTARGFATWLLIGWVIFFLAIPGAYRVVKDYWPLTAKALRDQNRAANLKGAEIFHPPGLEGVANQRKLANVKENSRLSVAQSWFARAEELTQQNDWPGAAEAEKNGRYNLDLAIAAREADAQYIKDKLASVKIPVNWWADLKSWFTGLDFGTISGKGFPARLIVVGIIILILGLLFLRKFPKSKMAGMVAVLGGVAILWSLFLFFTPEIAPQPPGSPGAALTATGRQVGTYTITLPACKVVTAGVIIAPGQRFKVEQLQPRLYYLKGAKFDVPVQTTLYEDYTTQGGPVKFRGGPVATTVTLTLN